MHIAQGDLGLARYLRAKNMLIDHVVWVNSNSLTATSL